MQDHLWESCGSVVSPDDLCRSLICLHRLPGSSAFFSGRDDLRCPRLMLVSCHLGDVITWWEQKLSALKIVVLSGRLRIAALSSPGESPRLISDIRVNVSAEYSHGLCAVKSGFVKSIPCYP
ncbi:UNVERIFIED_CONTAM: hypothetical protein NCL1_30775 [Trichonephila clavipes]